MKRLLFIALLIVAYPVVALLGFLTLAPAVPDPSSARSIVLWLADMSRAEAAWFGCVFPLTTFVFAAAGFRLGLGRSLFFLPILTLATWLVATPAPNLGRVTVLSASIVVQLGGLSRLWLRLVGGHDKYQVRRS